MSTILLIILALSVEYFFDDLKKYRNSNVLVQGYNYLEKKIKIDNLSKELMFSIRSTDTYTCNAPTILCKLSITIIYLLLSLVFLLYSLRTNQFNRDIEELKIKLEFNKDGIDKNMLFSLCPNLKQSRAKTNLSGLVIKNLFFNSIRNTFSVIFVFIILGAPAALAYKVLDIMIYSDSFKLNVQSKNNLKKYLYFIDYIPVRLTSYCFSIVSNYDHVIERINSLRSIE